MEDKNILSGDISVLSEYKQRVEQYADSKAMLAQATAEEKKLEKELASDQKNLRETVDSTIKKRRGEIADKFAQEIGKEEDKLKKIKAKRGKAKDKGVKGRIEEETAELVEQNKSLKKNISSALKEEKLPKFCGSGFYFTLYFTKGPGEIFLCALMILLVFLLLPAAVYLAIPNKGIKLDYPIPVIAFVYFVVVVIAFFVYKIIGDKTKHKHKDALLSVRALYDSINSNKKQISNIAHSIKRDKNEDMYNLEDFDAQIENLEATIKKMTEDKDSALEYFDKVSSNDIKNEIENAKMPKINEIEANLKAMTANKDELSEAVKQQGLYLSTNYEAYIGKEFADAAKLAELMELMETGNATTIGEAINMIKEKK